MGWFVAAGAAVLVVISLACLTCVAAMTPSKKTVRG